MTSRNGKPRFSGGAWLALAAVLLAAAPIRAQQIVPAATEPVASATPRGLFEATSDRKFGNVGYWQKVFDDPKRDEWQKPAEVVKALSVEDGMHVADLGAGTGYFMPYLSKAVGAAGAVFALEVEPNLLVHLRERAEEGGFANVVPVLTSFDRARLPEASVDLVLIADTYHHIDDRLEYLRRLRDVLRDEGRVAIVDWFKRELPQGPPLDHKIARDQVVEEMESAGYRLVDEPKILPYQYVLVFAPAARGTPKPER
jgi:predicted methyltransferase